MFQLPDLQVLLDQQAQQDQLVRKALKDLKVQLVLKVQLALLDQQDKPTDLEDAFTEIARKNLHVETLETRRSDSLDFHELSVWQIEEALAAAFEAGQQTSR